jgi:stage II sporulation protein D
MKKIGIYLTMVLIITIFVPTVIVKTFNFVSTPNTAEGKSFENRTILIPKDDKPIVIEEKRIEEAKAEKE